MNMHQLLRRVAVAACGFVLSLPVLFAQNKLVKGVVLDDTDQGVIGAAVMIKGTSTGVATDVDGKFELSCAPGDVLVVSSVGYDEVEVTVGDQTNLTIRLNIAQEILDDVVVIGYGTTRAKNFTGSVDVVKMSESPVADLGLSNVSDMIRGRLSGVVMGAESAATPVFWSVAAAPSTPPAPLRFSSSTVSSSLAVSRISTRLPSSRSASSRMRPPWPLMVPRLRTVSS